MNNHNAFIKRKSNFLLALNFIVAFFASVFFYCTRTNFVFIDTYTFKGCAVILLTLFFVNALLSFVLLTLSLYRVKIKGNLVADTKVFCALSCVSAFVGLLAFAGDIVSLIIMKSESAPIAFRFFIQALPGILFFFAGAVLIFIWPLLKKGKLKIALASIMSVCILLLAVNAIVPLQKYDFVSSPVVFDNGEEYNIVFATNYKGTGYVEYTYQGVDYKVYDEDNGRIKGDSCVHTISVPYQHLQNNSYRVGSARVVSDLSYGGWQDSDIVSQEYNFKTNTSDHQEFLVITDWHTKTDDAKTASKFAGNYDAIIALGDSVPGLMFEEEAVEYIIEFLGDLSNGEKPVIFARGNHETRGPYAAELSEDLGFENFFYTAVYGDYNFIVLDSGEDKQDSHPEYGNMVDFSSQRQKMVEWLCNLEIDQNKKNIVLVHDYNICLEDNLAKTAYEKLLSNNIHIMLSGHLHILEYRQNNGMDVIISGGHSSGDFKIVKMILDNNDITFEGYNIEGEKIFNHSDSIIKD